MDGGGSDGAASYPAPLGARTPTSTQHPERAAIPYSMGAIPRMPASKRPATRHRNPDRPHRSATMRAKPNGDIVAYIEWAFDVPVAPREKIILVALAARPGGNLTHLVRRTGMTEFVVYTALQDLLVDGWICHDVNGGYLIEISAEEIIDLPLPDSALASQLAQAIVRPA
jgi:hypothetical protein